ncbi:2-dehydropantoate 2-reductase [Powellomyces hirtus]|uniref:2-dehydropantoate 2-reductase n=1 Tax=Powellomyces hirtus TaxID=109895 RepID=A0A507E3A4_9FUNG|nr:2-dehydropantoate 2-reductase [Powellomyces hirtus]
MARIGIIGAGNVGLYIGAFLHVAGCQVSWVGRQWVQDEIEEAGALTVSDFYNHTFTIPADEMQILTDVADLVHADVNIDFLFLTVKAHATEKIMESIKHLDGKVVVVTLQNGIHNAEIIRKHMPNTEVITGMVPTNIVHLPGGHFHQATLGPIQLEDGEQSVTLAQLFLEAGFATQLTTDIRGILYGKLVINLMNALNALSGLPLRAQLSDPAHRKVLALCIEEALACYQAASITPLSFFKVPLWMVPHVLRLPNWLFFQIASTFLGIDERAMSSMHDDLLLKRPTEVDYLNGEIIKIGEEHSVNTPVNKAVVKLIKDIEAQPPVHPPSLSGEELLAIVQKRS